MAINSVSLVGRLVKDPEMKSVGDNIAVCQFTLAVDKRGKDAGTNFIDCTAWKGLAETITKYVKKGNLLGVVGSLDQQSWEKDGKKFTKIQVVVNDIQFLTPKNDKTPSEEAGLFNQKKEESEEIDLSAIPF